MMIQLFEFIKLRAQSLWRLDFGLFVLRPVIAIFVGIAATLHDPKRHVESVIEPIREMGQQPRRGGRVNASLRSYT